MNTIRITTTQNIELEYDLASLGERIVSYLIDTLVIIAYFIVCIFLFWSLQSSYYGSSYTWILFLFYLPVVFYSLAFEVFMNGQSIGKKVMKIKVISINGGRPTFGQYFLRWVFRLVDFSFTSCLCGTICIAVSERKQRVGDMVAGTAVIKTEPRTTFQQTLYMPAQPANYVVTYPQITTLGDEDIQLIKEVLVISRNSGNYSIAEKAAQKISATLNINSNMDAMAFLNLLLSDYNYLASKGDE